MCGGALGAAWAPTSGSLPGCARAVFVRVVFLRPWDARVARAGGSLRRRIYVDDLTLWARGRLHEVAPAVAEGVALTIQWERDAGWTLNAKKSVQFGSTLAGRKWLAARCPRLAVGRGFRDLGVQAAVVLVGRGAVALPASGNGVAGQTAVVVQLAEDGVEDGHEVMFQRPEAPPMYACFLADVAAGRVPAVLAPGEDCR